VVVTLVTISFRYYTLRLNKDARTGSAGGKQMKEISATELKQRLDGGEDIQIIDVREPNEYEV
jgi:hypothetical protein